MIAALATRVYGTAHLDGATWKITCEPHVAMVLKRLCRGIQKHAIKDLALGHTEANCADLAWFIQRYPLTVTPLEALTSGAKRHVDRVLRIADMVAGHTPPPAAPLALPLRPYQAVVPPLVRETGSLLLGDAVGVGKTATAIGTIVEPSCLPALIVVPLHLLGQWKREIARFAPHLRTYTTPGTIPKALPTIFGEGPDVVITSYTRLAGWARVMSEYVRSVVYDEVHELRGTGTKKSSAADHLAQAERIQVRLGMSATPIYNYGSEFYWVMSRLAPGRLGDYEEFCREWCRDTGGFGEKHLLRDPEAFGSWLRDQGLMLRRTRADIGRELPPVTVVTQTVDADPDAFQAMGEEAKALARIILGEAPAEKGDAFRAGGELDWKLRQATGMAKAPAVAAFVQMLVESGEPVLLGGWHRAVYDVWCAAFAQAGLRWALYTGSESAAAKQRAADDWCNGNLDVLIISLRSGAGLDGLQKRGSVVVHGELDWSPAVHEQLTGRLNRDEACGPVMSYYLVSDEGADPVIAETLGLKRGQLDGVMRKGDEAVTVVQGDGEHIKRLARRWLDMPTVATKKSKAKEIAHEDGF